MKQQLLINIFDDERKQKIKERTLRSIQFLETVQIDINNIIEDLPKNLDMQIGSRNSHYVLIIPQNVNEVIRLRISDHQSNPNEWVKHEKTGKPNQRYSIVVFDRNSMPIEYKHGLKETEWQTTIVDGIPVYEKCFNIKYLSETKTHLLKSLQTIYEGRTLNNENKQIKVYMNNTMNHKSTKKGVVNITEEKLNDIIKLSAIQMLENHEAQCNTNALQESVDKQVFAICEEVSKEFELGKPGTFRSGNSEDMEKYTHSIANTYNHAGTTRTATNSDLFAIGNGNESDTRYFNSKKDAIQWVKTYIKDEEQANILMSALQQFVRLGGGRFITNKRDINNN